MIYCYFQLCCSLLPTHSIFVSFDLYSGAFLLLRQRSRVHVCISSADPMVCPMHSRLRFSSGALDLIIRTAKFLRSYKQQQQNHVRWTPSAHDTNSQTISIVLWRPAIGRGQSRFYHQRNCRTGRDSVAVRRTSPKCRPLAGRQSCRAP